jgi:PAS domain S-box-containing protein
VSSSAGFEPTLTAEQLAALVEYSDDAIITKDRELRITSWNRAAERIYGWSAEEAIGRPISIIIPPHRSGEERQILDRILAGERVEHYETDRLTKDGQIKILSLTVSPIYGPDGDVVRASVIARDVTASHRSRELTERLHLLTQTLSKEVAPDRALDVLLEQAVPALGAAAGSVGLLNPETEEIELAGAIGHSEEGLGGWERFPLSADVPMSEAVRLNEAVWMQSTSEVKGRFAGLGDSRLRFESLAVIPLAVEGRPFGAVSLSFGERREFDLEERTFLTAAVQQAAYLLERARLFEAERLVAERLAFLAEASDLLSRSLELDDALQAVAGLAVDRLADWCGIELLEDSGDLRSVAVAHRDPEKVALAEEMRTRYPVDPASERGVPNVIRTGEAELYREISDELLVESSQDEEHLRLARELGLVSAMIVPLRARGRALGALTLVSSESGQLFDEDDLALAEDLARRAALAIDNALLFRREHEAAVVLQRALLPESLPEVPGLEFAAHYEPAAPGLEVGGDWYAVVPCDDGTFGIVIGDVAGRGIRAASTMGRLRPALRGFIADGHPPAEVMRRLDALIKAADRPELTTVFHLRYDPATGIGEYVRAGHPPAMLRLPDERVELLGGTGTPPVGILPDIDFAVHRVEIPPGSLVLLYTDGLIERRGDDLFDSLERLRITVGGCSATAATCLEMLADEYETDRVPDDVAMLARAVAGPGANGAT